MSIKKVRSLQNTFEKKPVVSSPEPASSPVQKRASDARRSTRAPSREGKEFFGAYLSPQHKARVYLIQAKVKGSEGRSVSLQDLIAEAMNDLYQKYDVPIVQDVEE